MNFFEGQYKEAVSRVLSIPNGAGTDRATRVGSTDTGFFPAGARDTISFVPDWHGRNTGPSVRPQPVITLPQLQTWKL